MDILRPKLINVGGRQYRYLSHSKQFETASEKEEEVTPYKEDFHYYDEPESCRVEADLIEKNENGYLLHIKDIPSYYFNYIYGKGGEQKQAIENQTKTSLKLPKKGQGGDIVLRGNNQSGILAAQSKILNIIDLNRRDQPSTHFLSISMVSNEITEAFNLFKKEVTQLHSRGVDDSIFQFPERLHLTLCMLQFLNDLELSNSVASLTQITKDVYSKHLGSDKLRICLKGVEYMNDDPSEVDVLYAKVEDNTKRIQAFVDELIQTLSRFSFVKKDHDKLKLHATLMNTIFRVDENKDVTNLDKSNRSVKSKRITFDARDILEKFEDFDFASVVVESIDINIRGRFETNGLYCKSATISLT